MCGSEHQAIHCLTLLVRIRQTAPRHLSIKHCTQLCSIFQQDARQPQCSAVLQCNNANAIQTMLAKSARMRLLSSHAKQASSISKGIRSTSKLMMADVFEAVLVLTCCCLRAAGVHLELQRCCFHGTSCCCSM